MLPDNPGMAKQPIFCFETMLNLLYWSCLVYDHDRVGIQSSSLVDKFSCIEKIVVSSELQWGFAVEVQAQLVHLLEKKRTRNYYPFCR